FGLEFAYLGEGVTELLLVDVGGDAGSVLVGVVFYVAVGDLLSHSVVSFRGGAVGGRDLLEHEGERVDGQRLVCHEAVGPVLCVVAVRTDPSLDSGNQHTEIGGGSVAAVASIGAGERMNPGRVLPLSEVDDLFESERS